MDAYVANRTGNTVWTNDGSGSFSLAESSLGDIESPSVSLGDVDGADNADAFVAGEPNELWINDGSAGFTASDQSPGDVGFDVVLRDLDGDDDGDAPSWPRGRIRVPCG